MAVLSKIIVLSAISSVAFAAPMYDGSRSGRITPLNMTDIVETNKANSAGAHSSEGPIIDITTGVVEITRPAINLKHPIMEIGLPVDAHRVQPVDGQQHLVGLAEIRKNFAEHNFESDAVETQRDQPGSSDNSDVLHRFGASKESILTYRSLRDQDLDESKPASSGVPVEVAFPNGVSLMRPHPLCIAALGCKTVVPTEDD